MQYRPYTSSFLYSENAEGDDVSEELIKELEELDLSNMTPIEALNELYHLKTMVLNRNLI